MADHVVEKICKTIARMRLQSIPDNSSIIDNIDNNIIDKNNNIDKNINNRPVKKFSPYALNEDFDVNKNELTFTAFQISTQLHDADNFAFHYKTVKKIGTSEARRLFQETVDDVRNGPKLGKPVKNPAALYHWKVNQLIESWKKL